MKEIFQSPSIQINNNIYTIALINAVVSHASTHGHHSTIVEKVPKPTVSDSTVLIKAVTRAVNQIDYLLLAGRVPSDGKIVGYELSGIVEDVGNKITRVKSGDYVSAFVGGEWAEFESAFSEYVVGESAILNMIRLVSEVIA